MNSTKLSVLEWARERYENTIRLATDKAGADRDGWLEDAEYWRAIIELLQMSTARQEIAVCVVEKD